MPTIDEILTDMDYGTAPESTQEAQAWLDAHQRRFGLFIDNRWSAPADAFSSLNPADASVLAELTQAGDADIERAVQAARRAQPLWQALGGHGRARILYALARLLQKHARLFAVLATLDSGKTIRQARDIDLPLAVRHFYHHAGWAQLQSDEFPDQRPVGVVAQIVARHFPLRMLAWKIAPALACANTVVFKPAASTSLSALLFAELCQKAGVPAGVVNIVTGDGRAGAALAGHPGIDKIAFTGSLEVGRAIRIASAGSGKKLTLALESGGNDAFIVFDDADLDAAVEGLVDAIWCDQDQDLVRCAGARLLVQESVEQRLLGKLRVRMATLRAGAALDKSSDTVLLPNAALPPIEALSFRTPQEAVQLANNTSHGLAASIWTESVSLALAVASDIKAGSIWINSSNLFDAACGAGGVRASGFGREGGREGMFEYMTPLAEDARPSLPLTVALPLAANASAAQLAAPQTGLGPIDRSAKLTIGGQQVRPDSGDSHAIFGVDGSFLAEVGTGSGKDVHNAVEAAHKASSWAAASAHNRAQVLYCIAENLAVRAAQFGARIAAMTGAAHPELEVEAAIERLFYYAAWADKYDGLVHQRPLRGSAIALNEPLGVIGIICPNEAPLLGFVALVAPAIALGNRVVVVPSQAHPLSALDLAQVLDASDLPGGVVNIVSAGPGNGANAGVDQLARTLAGHFDVDAVWRHDGSGAGCLEVERLASASMKRTWVGGIRGRDWTSLAQSGGRTLLAHASQVKNIWIPHGV
jgi:aldehyde dehydrogenase (NAD+)